MSWNYPTAVTYNVYVYPVWTIEAGVIKQRGRLHLATDASGNILIDHCTFRDTASTPNVFHTITKIDAASGSPNLGGSLDFTLDDGTHFAGGSSQPNLPASFFFTGILSQFEEAQTNWGAGHQSGAVEEAA